MNDRLASFRRAVEEIVQSHGNPTNGSDDGSCAELTDEPYPSSECNFFTTTTTTGIHSIGAQPCRCSFAYTRAIAARAQVRIDREIDGTETAKNCAQRLVVIKRWCLLLAREKEKLGCTRVSYL